jgi:hypothetical protein
MSFSTLKFIRRFEETYRLNCRMSFNWLHGVISQKTNTLHNHRCDNLKSYKLNLFRLYTGMVHSHGTEVKYT